MATTSSASTGGAPSTDAAAANVPPPPGVANLTPFGANRPGEPAFQLKIEPEFKVSFKSNNLTKGQYTVPVRITNMTKFRQCYKV